MLFRHKKRCKDLQVHSAVHQYDANRKQLLPCVTLQDKLALAELLETPTQLTSCSQLQILVYASLSRSLTRRSSSEDV